MYVLGALSLTQRENRWIASCGEHRGGRAGRLQQQNAGRKRNLRVFFNLFLVARSQSTRNKQSAKRPKMERWSTQNRTEIDEKIEPKAVLNRSWSVRGSPNAPGTHPGRSRDALRTLPERAWTSPGRSWGSVGSLRGHPGTVRAAPGTFLSVHKASPERPGTPVKPVRVAERSSRPMWIDF